MKILGMKHDKVVTDDPIKLEEPEAYTCTVCLGIDKKNGKLCKRLSCRTRKNEYRLLRSLIAKNGAPLPL